MSKQIDRKLSLYELLGPKALKKFVTSSQILQS